MTDAQWICQPGSQPVSPRVNITTDIQLSALTHVTYGLAPSVAKICRLCIWN